MKSLKIQHKIRSMNSQIIQNNQLKIIKKYHLVLTILDASKKMRIMNKFSMKHRLVIQPIIVLSEIAIIKYTFLISWLQTDQKQQMEQKDVFISKMLILD